MLLLTYGGNDETVPCLVPMDQILAVLIVQDVPESLEPHCHSNSEVSTSPGELARLARAIGTDQQDKIFAIL